MILKLKKKKKTTTNQTKNTFTFCKIFFGIAERKTFLNVIHVPELMAKFYRILLHPGQTERPEM